MFIVVHLGPKNEYLGLKAFGNEQAVNNYVFSLSELIIANIEGVLPLKERLKLAPEYFPFAGRVQDFYVEEV